MRRVSTALGLSAAMLLTVAGEASAPTGYEPLPREAFVPVVRPVMSPTPSPSVAVTAKPRPAPTSEAKVEVKAPTVRQAKAYARSKLGATQYACLDKLFTKESGWRTTAENRSSGAYGIPQALPGSKMKSAGSDWRTNPLTQVKWGLRYIKARYGSACKAWQHSKSFGWY